MNVRPVVLIDHDPEWCARVCRFLEPHGIPVVTARNIDAALEAMEQFGKPSALLMDIATRRENGRAVSAIRRDPSLRQMPVGYVKKSAALDAVLLMLLSSAAAAGHEAA